MVRFVLVHITTNSLLLYIPFLSDLTQMSNNGDFDSLNKLPFMKHKYKVRLVCDIL